MVWAGRRIVAGSPVFLFRPRIGMIICAGTAAALVAWAVIEWRENAASAALRLPAMAAVALSVFAWFGRPAVRVDRTGVRLQNVLADVQIPYGAIDHVDDRYALTLVDREDRRYRAWAAPASRGRGRPPTDDPGWWDPDRLALPPLRNDAVTVAAVVRTGRQRHRLTVGVGPGFAPVVRRPLVWLWIAWSVCVAATAVVLVAA